MSARRSSWKSRGRTVLPRQAERVCRLASAQGWTPDRRWSPWEVMKASQTQATSPKVRSPFQQWPEAKWRSRISATWRVFKVARRTGRSSTRSTRWICGKWLLILAFVFPRPFLGTPFFGGGLPIGQFRPSGEVNCTLRNLLTVLEHLEQKTPGNRGAVFDNG